MVVIGKIVPLKHAWIAIHQALINKKYAVHGQGLERVGDVQICAWLTRCISASALSLRSE